jgi:NADPH2:quinone reductase
MRAAYYEAFGGPENLQIGERPDPVPEVDQMLVRIHSAGTCS